jgi:hypothetical protein
MGMKVENKCVGLMAWTDVDGTCWTTLATVRTSTTLPAKRLDMAVAEEEKEEEDGETR